MRRRQKLSGKRSKRMFRRSSNRHKMNRRYKDRGIKRGGVRL